MPVPDILSTAARAVSSDVKHGIRASVAARRMANPSCNTSRSPVTVFTTACAVPSSMMSTTFGCPDSRFGIAITGSPSPAIIAAVPSVAYIWQPDA